MKFIKEVLLTWQAIAWAILILIMILLFANGWKINSVRGGSLEIVFNDRARELGVFDSDEFKFVKTLDESDLKLFLIMGGKRGRIL